MGWHGRKGPKKDYQVMGSTLKFMSFKCHSPLFIVDYINSSYWIQSKYYYERNQKEGKGFKFLICLDGSKKGLKLLEIAFDLKRNEYDEIHSATVSESKY